MALPAFAPTPQPPPTTFAGVRGPNDAVSSKRLKADVSDTLLLTEPSTTPAAFMVGKLRERRTATQFEYTHLEMRPYPRALTLTVAYAGGNAPGAATTLTFSVADAAKIVPNNVLRHDATGVLYLVVSVAGAGVVTVLENIGGPAVDAGNALTATTDDFTVIHSAYREGSDIGGARKVNRPAVSNFWQIFRTPYGWTGRQLNTEFYGGSDKDVVRKW